jgi:hypothetical protein
LFAVEVIPAVLVEEKFGGGFKVRLPDGNLLDLPKISFGTEWVGLWSLPVLWLGGRGERKRQKACPHPEVVQWQQTLGVGPFARRVERSVCLHCGLGVEMKAE